MPKNVMLKERLCLQAYLCSQRALPNETNCAWIVASEGTPMTSPTYKMGESDVFDVLDSVAAALNVDNEQNKMLSHVKISETTNASVAAAIRSAAKCCNNRIRLDFSTWEMFIFVCRERTWERLHVSHACLREDTPTVSIKSTVFTEESSVYPVSTNFQEVKEAPMEVLNDLPRQYVSVDSEQICRGDLARMSSWMAYLACEQLFPEPSGGTLQDCNVQVFGEYVTSFMTKKKTDTMCMCDDCGTWHLSPDGFVIHESDRFFCNYVRKRCYAPGLDQTALRTVKKAKADTPGPETETEIFVRPLKSLAESSQYFRSTNFELGADDNVQEEGKRDTLTLLPTDVLGSNLICRSQSTTFTNQCPWCGKYFQPWKGEKVDLLSDLPDITLELRRDLVSHERGNKCIFWGLRINRSVKNVPVTAEPTIRLSILKSIVSVLGYGKSKSRTERRCITIADCATKEQFLQKIEKIFSEAERFLHSSKTNPGSLDASSPRLVFFSFEYAKATVIRGTVISVVHGRGHFVVLEVNVEKRVIEVWDGKDYDVTTWTETISYLLRKIKLLDFDCKPTFKDGRDKRVQLSMWVRGIKEWTVTRTRMLKQDDDYNCGPIACLRVWETLVPGDVDVGQLSPNDFRGVIVRKFDQLFGELKNNLIWGNEELEEATYTRTKRTIRSEITEIMD
ncbi:hypothetical protein IV203_014786 [Nitzschia inconspicua]|uniref:Uncharacterized protein n=1 Tax=Nitzschia inconspicua TaxID=303405 RepID=A0A9K3K784_9STRA|nr:hypothetical protein IV203_020270 [Nitzschia inconspicua]KAG7358199.1 hypothetical protein IV203_014786 [Nitzschia inconspicua]